jgi:hypothetical protein
LLAPSSSRVEKNEKPKILGYGINNDVKPNIEKSSDDLYSVHNFDLDINIHVPTNGGFIFLFFVAF